MAVEARHLNLFPPQLLPNRDHMMMRPIDTNTNNNAAGAAYNFHQVAYGGLPLSGTTTVDTTTPPLLPAMLYADSLPPKTPLKSTDSALSSYNIPPLLSRKRSRVVDTTHHHNSSSSAAAAAHTHTHTHTHTTTLPPYSTLPRDQTCTSSFSFLGDDISLQIEHHHLDVDRLIAQHMEKVRLEIEERRKNQARRILEAVEVRLAKRLRSKEEEIDKIAKMNWALEERIKSLCIENQIWRDLAQTNEATANALRTNLEQVLAHVKDDNNNGGAVTGLNNNMGCTSNDNHDPALVDDAQSCCDSSGAGDERGAAESSSSKAAAASNERRWCRSCRREEARVLLLPCRHLCLCTVCGSSLHTCPVCNSAKTASVHVNVS